MKTRWFARTKDYVGRGYEVDWKCGKRTRSVSLKCSFVGDERREGEGQIHGFEHCVGVHAFGGNGIVRYMRFFSLGGERFERGEYTCSKIQAFVTSFCTKSCPKVPIAHTKETRSGFASTMPIPNVSPIPAGGELG
jgi:hypothetical protein